MKKAAIPLALVTLVFIVFIVIYPKACLEAAAASLELWLKIIVPALLPFFIGTAILMQTGIIRLIGAFFEPVTRVLFGCPGESAYVFCASALSGYPMGAKICAELYKDGQLSEEAAQRTALFTSVSGPLFIFGSIACGMLGIPEAGLPLALAHYAGALFTGIFFSLVLKRLPGKKTPYFLNIRQQLGAYLAQSRKNGNSLGKILEQAVTGSVGTLLLIGGFIIAFNVIITLLQKTGVLGFLSGAFNPLLRLLGVSSGLSAPFFSGLIEMTTGSQAAAAFAAPLSERLAVIAFLVSFGGFSILVQSYAVAAKSGLKLKHFIPAKIMQACASFAAACLLIPVFGLSVPVFFPEAPVLSPPPEGLYYIGSAVLLCALAVLAFNRLLVKRRSA